MTAEYRPAPPRRRWLVPAALLAALALAAGGWLAYRYTAPVEVRLASAAPGLPFEIEMLPPVVRVRPGEMVSVTYRIRNTNIMPIAAWGSVRIEPAEAVEQVDVFLTQCGGLNTFQNSVAEDYAVIFRVRPAGLSGATQLTLRHDFEPVTPP
jgi:hypothetical protein